MSFLGSLAQAVVDVVAVPVAAVIDVAEMGKNDRTRKQVEKVQEDLSDAIDL